MLLLRPWGYALVILIVVCHAVTGQRSATDASITGTVSDVHGAVIAGATVTVRDAATNQARTATTDSQGVYRFSILPVSTFEITASANGFEPRRDLKITLELGRTTTLDISMVPSGGTYDVTVRTQQAEMDPTQTAATTSIDTESVEELPVNSRNYLQFSLLAPGVAPSQNSSQTGTSTTATTPLGDSGFSFGGLRPRSNSIAIDGLTNIDETTGASLIVLSPEIVREFQVINNGVSAEFGGAAGGTINVITKTGSNVFHGTAFTFIQNEHLNARNPIDASTTRPLYRRYQPGMSLGGPLKKDRLFFYVAAEQENLHADDRSEISRSVRTPINTALAAGFAPRLPVRVLSGSTFRTGADETELAGKLTWLANTFNTVNVRFAYTNVRNRGDAFNLDALADPTSRGTTYSKDHQITGSWARVIDADKVNEFRGQFSTRHFTSRAGVQPGLEIDVVGAAMFGDPWNAGSDRREKRTELVDSFTLTHHSHELKFGGSINHVSLDSQMPTGSGGLYVFRSVADFLTSRPVEWRQSFGASAANFSVNNLGVFVEDRWTYRRNITLNLGGRYDVETLPKPFRTDNDNFSPRLGIAWALAKDTVIRGGFGLFYDRQPLAFLVPAITRDGTNGFEQTAFDTTAAAIFTANSGGSVLSPVAGIAPSIYRGDPTMKTPYSIQSFIGAELAVAKNTTVKGEFLFTRGLHLPRTRNINLAPPAILTAANAAVLGFVNPTPQQLGRLVFGSARIDPRYDGVYQLEDSSSSTYRGLSLSMRSQLSEEITALASYTLSKTNDDASDFFEQPVNPYDLRSERAPSSIDVRHRLVLSGVFELPFGDDENKGATKTKEGFFTELLSDIELAPIVTLASGRPYTPLTGADEEHDLAYPFASRPLGLSRNSARLPRFFNADLRAVKYLPLGPDPVRRLDLAFEFFNLFNHPSAAVLSPYFGSDLTPLPTYGRPILFDTPRQFRFSIDLEF